MNRIIYSNENGGVSILTPTDSALATMTIQDIALKIVPAGLPFKIIKASSIPSDRTFRNAWEADMSSPDGVGIGYEAWLATQNTGDAA